MTYKFSSLLSTRIMAPALIFALLTFGMGYLVGGKGQDSGSQGHGKSQGATTRDLQELKVYVCPMNCVPPIERAGKCPVCGMELIGVPAQAFDEDEPPRIVLSERSLAASGIQVAPVEKKFVNFEIRLFGRIEYDPAELRKVAAFAPGVIERVYVERAGELVRAREPLFDIHSSDLFYLKQELSDVLAQFPDLYRDPRPARERVTARLVRPPARPLPARGSEKGEPDDGEKTKARERLEQLKRKLALLGLSIEDADKVIAEGRPTGVFTVTAPIGGIVMAVSAVKGKYVSTGETLFTIANPRNLWAKFEAYASDFSWLRLGQEAEFETDSLPGERFKGRVLSLNPMFDEQRRTFEVGVLYLDPGSRLRPNMLVRGVVNARMTEGGVSATEIDEIFGPPLVIPETAPLVTGKRAIVYVEVPGTPGTFEAREVLLGPRAKGYYVVKQGLQQGEMVVTNGNFKIDSALQILSKGSMMEPRAK